jgi:hypothetical protein
MERKSESYSGDKRESEFQGGIETLIKRRIGIRSHIVIMGAAFIARKFMGQSILSCS